MLISLSDLLFAPLIADQPEGGCFERRSRGGEGGGGFGARAWPDTSSTVHFFGFPGFSA